MTAHPQRCKLCRFGGARADSGGWCYKKPASNGGHRQWIDQETYNSMIALLGCASFEPEVPA